MPDHRSIGQSSESRTQACAQELSWAVDVDANQWRFVGIYDQRLVWSRPPSAVRVDVGTVHPTYFSPWSPGGPGRSSSPIVTPFSQPPSSRIQTSRFRMFVLDAGVPHISLFLQVVRVDVQGSRRLVLPIVHYLICDLLYDNHEGE